jgi:hypothetical protein
VKSVQRCIAMAQLLVEQNFPAIAIHRGMTQEERLSRYDNTLLSRYDYTLLSRYDYTLLSRYVYTRLSRYDNTWLPVRVAECGCALGRNDFGLFSRNVLSGHGYGCKIDTVVKYVFCFFEQFHARKPESEKVRGPNRNLWNTVTVR